MREIKRKKVRIDPELVSDKCSHGNNHVLYYLWHSKNKFDAGNLDDLLKEIKSEKTTYKHASVCFGSMLSTIYNSVWKPSPSGKHVLSKTPYNRIIYVMQEDSRSKTLTPEEKRTWIKECKEHRMLPNYVELKDVEYYKATEIPLTLDLRRNMSPTLLYVYLSNFRYLRENVGFVRSVLHLHCELNMDFFAAFICASRVSINYTTHHYLTLQRRYGQKNGVNIVDDIPLSTITGLKRFIRSPKRHDKRTLDQTRSGYYGYNTIEQISKAAVGLTAQELFDPIVIKAFSAITDETTRKYLAKFKNRRSKIKYVEA